MENQKNKNLWTCCNPLICCPVLSFKIITVNIEYSCVLVTKTVKPTELQEPLNFLEVRPASTNRILKEASSRFFQSCVSFIAGRADWKGTSFDSHASLY